MARGAVRALLGAVCRPPLSSLWRPWRRNSLAILMLHRFDPHPDVRGHSAAELAALLEELRRQRVPIHPLADVAERIAARRPVPEGVCLTVDDGYADVLEHALPVFTRFDAPFTVFLTTGFVDGALWQWWDQVAWMIGAGERSERTIAQLKALPHERRLARLGEIAAETGRRPPDAAPPGYGPLSWEDARRAERSGLARFGPHTVSHPILASTDDATASFEIAESWARCRAELASPVPVFCYPNGDGSDFGEREERLVEQSGLAAALTTIPGYLTPGALAAPRARWRLPRFAAPRDAVDLAQIASGFEAFKTAVRGS